MRGYHRNPWFLTIISILLMPFLAVHVQEMIFRHRAEQLLTDIRVLMSGAAFSGMWFSVHDDWQGLTLHPNYVIVGVYPNTWYPPWATSTYVAFGPHAAAADIARLASFDLSCLTRLAPCRERSELMPEAAAPHAKEEFQLAKARKDHVCGPEIIGLMARDALYAGLVAVTAIHSSAPAACPAEQLWSGIITVG